MLRNHIAKDFNPLAYLLTALFLAVCITFNYIFDFEDSILERLPTSWQLPASFLYYLFPYVAVSFLILPFYGKQHLLKSSVFWIPVVFIITCITFDSGFPIYAWIVKGNFHTGSYWIANVLKNLLNIPFVLIPAYIFYKSGKEQNHFYGVTKSFDPIPYFHLLLIMIPLLIAASLLENFNSFYPMYKPTSIDEHWGVSEGLVIAIYELAYGWNFLSVEFIFRGFLVIGMAKILGRQSILPMVALYCFYHFGKPEGEAISSIFGGYILGVIAYETRSIFGGVLIHIGIAWIMELLGFIHKDLI